MKVILQILSMECHHGGLAIGFERITAKILGLENVREASFNSKRQNKVSTISLTKNKLGYKTQLF